jgi:hypothetical protein
MRVKKMSLKSKIIILVCVYLAGYVTALKLKPEPPPKAEIAKESTQKSVAKKVTKKYDPKTGALESETSEELEQFLNNRLTAKVPVKTVYKHDALIVDIDSSLRVGALVKPYALLPLPIIPKDLYIGYAKDLRTGEDIYRAAYTVFTKE